METCSCAHEQQVRHLKSRLSQLEIMLDKTQKRLNVATQAATQNSASRPIIQRAPSFDAKKAEEQQRRLQADLEAERKVKADLMANLKQVTMANESAQARLVQELSETRAQRDSAIADLDDLQEEMDGIRSRFLTQCSSEEDEIEARSSHSQGAKDAATSSHSTEPETRLTPDHLRTFASQLQLSQEQRLRKTLQSIAQHCPADLVQSTSDCDCESLEMRLCETLEEMSAGYLSDKVREELQKLLHVNEVDSSLHVETSSASKTSTDELVSLACKHISELTRTRNVQVELLYKSVPAAFQDLFTLLNRTLSFTFPEKSSTFDDTSRDAYQTFLASTDTALTHTIRKYITSHQKSRQKISYRAFAAGDLALFLPTRNANSPAWAAFNVGAPHYFLAMDGVDTEGKDFLIGRIQDISEKIGEPGIESMSPPSARPGQPIKKWWEVKILEKKKVAA